MAESPKVDRKKLPTFVHFYQNVQYGAKTKMSTKKSGRNSFSEFATLAMICASLLSPFGLCSCRWVELLSEPAIVAIEKRPLDRCGFQRSDQGRTESWPGRTPSGWSSNSSAMPAAPGKIGRASCRKECRSRWSPYH